MSKQFTGKSVLPKKITFKFVKAADFKTVGINGVFGGGTVQRHINMNFYVDTLDIPNTASHTIEADNRIGPLIPHEKDSISAVREMPFGVIFDLQTAKSMVIWLNQKIKELEEANLNLTMQGVKETNK